MLQVKPLLSPISTYEIIPFDATHQPPSSDLARLHGELLPRSPITLLGPLFARSIYYRLLPKQGLIFGAVAYINQQPVGFAVATHIPNSFMRMGLRRHFLRLFGVIAISLLQQPSKRLKAIWEVLQIMKGLPSMNISPLEAELLSFGVLPDYRYHRLGCQPATRPHIAMDLFDSIVAQVQAHQKESIRTIVDSNNIAAQSFYHKAGWDIRESNIPGWRVSSVEMIWRSR